MFSFFIMSLVLCNILFFLAFVGLINNRNNLLLILISIELSYLMIIALFAISSVQTKTLAESVMYSLLFLIIAASESAMGLAILIITYNSNSNIKISKSQYLYG